MNYRQPPTRTVKLKKNPKKLLAVIKKKEIPKIGIFFFNSGKASASKVLLEKKNSKENKKSFCGNLKNRFALGIPKAIIEGIFA